MALSDELLFEAYDISLLINFFARNLSVPSLRSGASTPRRNSKIGFPYTGANQAEGTTVVAQYAHLLLLRTFR